MIIGLAVGFVIGFVLSMPPLGPTYFLVIERSLKKQVKNGIAIGVGAALMDMIYILAAYGGVSAIISILPMSIETFLLQNEDKLKIILALAGSVVVILYGIKILRTKSDPGKGQPIKQSNEKLKKRYETVEKVFKKTEVGLHKILRKKELEEKFSDMIGSFAKGVGSCLSSVTLPASWFALVGYLKSYGIIDSNFFTGLLLSIGVLLGTSTWFYVLSTLISKHTEKIKPRLLNKLNMSTGIFLVLLGSFFLVKVSLMFL